MLELLTPRRAAFAVFSLLAAGAPTARAQTCPRGCEVGEAPDATGCCGGAASYAPLVPLPPAPAQVEPCPTGQLRTHDSQENCCWPGQVWADGRCRGVPTACPATHRLEASEERCGLAACGAGLVRVSDGVHCCWPGQVSANGQCRGVPASCPAEHRVVPERETCEPLPACAPGLARAGDGATCCYPGQRVGRRGGCVGTPTACPEGQHPSARSHTCEPDLVCEPGRAVAGDHEACCWPGQRVEQGRCVGERPCPAGLVSRDGQCLRVWSESRLHWSGPVVLGAGALLGGLSVPVWLEAGDQTSELSTQCRRGCPSTWRNTAENIRTLDAITNALAFTGGGLALTGVILLVAARTHTQHAEVIEVSAVPGGLGVAGHF